MLVPLNKNEIIELQGTKFDVFNPSKNYPFFYTWGESMPTLDQIRFELDPRDKQTIELDLGQKLYLCSKQYRLEAVVK